MIIEESEMRFGEYDPESVFYIEKSGQYQSKLRPNGIKSCEFILKRGSAVYFIEAKKTNPKEITADSGEEKIEKYHRYINDILEKMRHSIILYANILLSRYDTADVPESMLEKDLSDIELKLVLVVKNAREEWLSPLQETLQREMKKDSLLWKFHGPYVINEEKARRKRFVV